MSENSWKSGLWPFFAMCLGVLGFVGIWLTVSVWLDQPCLWMSILAVVDIALILRFTGMRAGWRLLLATLIGAGTITIASQWLIAAQAFGLVLELSPWESAHRIGPVLTWEFSRLRLMAADVMYPIAALLLASYLGLHRPK